MKFDKKTFGRMVASTREFRNLTMREAAAEVNISHSTISRAEREEAVDMDSFAALCGWIGTNPTAFFERTDVPAAVVAPGGGD